MTTDRHTSHGAIEHANAVITAAENGAYDKQVGIVPQERALINKVASDDMLTRADVAALAALGRHDLIDTAHRADRINLNPDQEN